LRVGFEVLDVTPPIGVRLGGYAHRLAKPSNSIHDPLYIHTIFLEGDGGEALIVSVDVLGVSRDLAEGIKDEISRKTGLGRKAIFLTATHTHSGPETVTPMWPNTYPYTSREKEVLEDWIEKLKDRIARASLIAMNRIAKAEIRVGTTKAEGLTYNRTYKGGLVDEDIPYIYFKTDYGRMILMNYTCHPTCNTDLGVSSDYPGAIYSKMDEYKVKCTFTTGAAGDIDPKFKGRRYMDKMASKIALNVLEDLTSKSIELERVDLEIEEVHVNVKFKEPPRIIEAKRRYEEALREYGGRLDEEEYMWKLLYAEEEYEVAKDGRIMVETLFKILRIGREFIMISIPGELFVEHGLKIKSHAYSAGYGHVMLSNYSEDYIGYIPDMKAYEIDAYEAKLTRWSRITPQSANELVSRIIGMVRQM
jgi:hypothetical protein